MIHLQIVPNALVLGTMMRPQAYGRLSVLIRPTTASPLYCFSYAAHFCHLFRRYGVGHTADAV